MKTYQLMAEKYNPILQENWFRKFRDRGKIDLNSNTNPLIDVILYILEGKPLNVYEVHVMAGNIIEDLGEEDVSVGTIQSILKALEKEGAVVKDLRTGKYRQTPRAKEFYD